MLTRCSSGAAVCELSNTEASALRKPCATYSAESLCYSLELTLPCVQTERQPGEERHAAEEQPDDPPAPPWRRTASTT
ncbi:hypothetical protein GCM10010357_61650 [Streptomyces luteireticuli]|uniref:Uncharacterized protein n=1 Tax=Streptomyces luteireticuli TaxID=173858 RepID=A0ABN0Z4F9_9ACTN